MNNITDIKNAFYINLDSRHDRKIHVEEQLNLIGIKSQRFSAIKLTNGALGCSMSHLRCIEIAKTNDWDHVLIVEDDIKFLSPEVFISQFNKFLQIHKEWDVVLIAGNNLPPYTKIDNTCIKVNMCQTTTGYIVKKHYYDTLINNMKNGINNLIREPDRPSDYAIDKYWFSLQQKDKWYLIIPLTVTQREDYSDIEKKVINYTNSMTDIDKPYLFVAKNKVSDIIQISDIITVSNIRKVPNIRKINSQFRL